MRANAQIQVTGPAFSRTLTTDSTGIYEVDDLTPGDYTLELAKPETQELDSFSGNTSPASFRVGGGGAVEKNFALVWNGRIEGQVKDNAGRPAHAWIQLLSADGGQIPGYANYAQMTATDGSYQLHKVPPGRYVVELNAYGRSKDSPYGVQYYPSGIRREDARVFELTPGQRITSVDFQVSGSEKR